MKIEDFKFDFKTVNPMPREITIIEVEIGKGKVPLQNYAEGLHDALCFNSYYTMQAGQPLEITVDSLTWYLETLLEARVSIVNGNFRDKSVLRELFIPSFFQLVLSLIGKVNIREKGIELVPKWTSECEELRVKDGRFDKATRDRLLDISNKLGYYEKSIHLEKAAMPYSSEGDHNLMMTAVIGDHICAISPVEHGFYTYATAFLRLKILEETTFSILYRVQYDDANLVARYLSTRREVFV